MSWVQSLANVMNDMLEGSVALASMSAFAVPMPSSAISEILENKAVLEVEQNAQKEASSSGSSDSARPQRMFLPTMDSRGTGLGKPSAAKDPTNL
jgi:hypothetical protein